MPLDPAYRVDDVARILSPGLLFFKDLIRKNIARAVELAGSPARLRPHVKTHKTREIVQMERSAGIAKHKCATIAEAEMLADCGAEDVLVAYPLSDQIAGGWPGWARAFPQCRFAAIVDHSGSARALSDAMTAEEQQIDVLLDVDTGQHRTGVPMGPVGARLYEECAVFPG